MPNEPTRANQAKVGEKATCAHGKVVAIHGSVIGLEFASGDLPAIRDALEIEWDRPHRLVVEVQQHVDPRRVRAVALQDTAGLACGALGIVTDQPIRVRRRGDVRARDQRAR